MEELLCDAAMRGDLNSLDEIIAKDNYILDKVLVGSFKGKNPLHLAISTGQAEFVLAILKIKPDLAEVTNTEQGAALHIASANGDVRIVEALVKLSPEMCMARDRDGYNPLHIAAMKGKVNVLEKLVHTCPRAVQVTTYQGDTILHICVNHNQLESLQLLLKMITDPKFVQSREKKGNTILHLAVFGKRLQIIEYLLLSTEVDVIRLNEDGWAAMDICFFVQNRSDQEEENRYIQKLLNAAMALRQSQIWVVYSPFQKKLQQTLMVVASLFATMAFQVGVNPPGGVWQDDSKKGDLKQHLAGKAVLAYEYPVPYSFFMCCNTVGFLVSLSSILSLLMIVVPVPKSLWGFGLPALSLLTIMATAFTYTYSIVVVSPKHVMKVSFFISCYVIVWAFVTVPLTVLIVASRYHVRTNKAKQIISTLASERQRLLPNAVGENMSTV